MRVLAKAAVTLALVAVAAAASMPPATAQERSLSGWIVEQPLGNTLQGVIPLAGIVVTFGTDTATTDADGFFIFTDPPEGSQSLALEDPSGTHVRLGTNRFEAVGDTNIGYYAMRRLPATPPPGATVRGDVSGDALQVELIGTGGYFVADEHDFEFTDVPPGSYVLRSNRVGDYLYYPGTANAAEAVRIEISDTESLGPYEWRHEFQERLAGGCDANGDGYGDLVVPASREDFRGTRNVGVAHLLFGGPNGFAVTGTQTMDPGRTGGATQRQADAEFGSAHACGDFNGDGFDDVAIGAPGTTVGGHEDAGLVVVFEGTESGISPQTAYVIHQNRPNVQSAARAGERFGHALAAGDFDGNGFADLAVGVPGQMVGQAPRAGAVHIFPGAIDGLSGRGDFDLHQRRRGVDGAPQDGDQFGFSLASGNLWSDPFDDLIVGTPFEDVGTVRDAGTAHVFPGGFDGLQPRLSTEINQSTFGVPDTPNRGDRLGYSVAIDQHSGVLNTFSFGGAWVAIGVPGELVNGRDRAGAVHIINAGAWPLHVQHWHQDSPGRADGGLESPAAAGTAERGDGLGSSVAFVGLARAQSLAVGVPGEDLQGRRNAGAVQLLRTSGATLNLRWIHDEIISQATPGISTPLERGDRFGSDLASVVLTNDGPGLLAVGVPNEALGRRDNAGLLHLVAVPHIIEEGPVTEIRSISQRSGDLAGRAEAGDWFGG